MPTNQRERQVVRYVHTPDGVALAWTAVGRGPTLVKASNWLTHLELEWDSPLWRHWLAFLASHFLFVRYDERGCGMSDWDVADLGHERWADDLDVIAGTTSATEPIVLLGISQGGAAAIDFAVRHPERVSHLVLYGCYSRGWRLRDKPDLVRHHEAMLELIDIGWGGRTRAFTELYTARFIPGGTDDQLEWFNDLCRKSVPRSNAARLLSARGHADVRALLPHVRVPTLVLHAREDAVIGVEEGRILAAEIPDAHFVELDSANHILLSDEPAWERFCQAMLDFTGTAARVTASPAEDAFAVLSERERQVLGLVAAGLSNAEIATTLVISDKTVRNHVSHVFAKLGVWTRPQAIVLAKENGF